MTKQPPTISQGVGCGLLLIPIIFVGGGAGLGKIVELLNWLFG
jgi:hypothetical protein